MIFGHLGVAGGVRALQRDPRGTLAFMLLCVASVAPDVVDVGYSLAGICSPYGLYSHTLPALALECAVVGGAVWLSTRSAGLLSAFVVVILLHLATDYVTMTKLVWPGGEMAGLGFYSQPLLDFLVEAPLIIGGWWLLRRSRRGPAWCVSAGILALGLALQGGLDTYFYLTHRVLKPNACWTDHALPLNEI